MKFNEKIETENNIVKYSLTASYNENLTDDEIQEIETLHDYIRKIKLSEIDFTSNIIMTNGRPTVTENDDASAIEVSLGKIAPKEYVLDENLNIEFSIDAGRIADSEINGILTSKGLVSQAKIAVFQYKIKDAVSKLIEEARAEDNSFENETEIII